MEYKTPVKTIRAKCLDCCAESALEVRECAAVNCPLHPWRMGRRPKDYKPKQKNAESAESDN